MTTSLRVGFVSLAVLVAQATLHAQGAPYPQSPYPTPQAGQPAGTVYGQPGGPDDGSAEAEDVPGRGVARISLINGDVSVRRGDSGEVIAAAVNAPLVASDRVLTGPAARTELQLDAANRLRVAPDSDLRLAEIEYRRYTVELGRGTITWHVSRTSGSDIDINTPSVSIRPVQPGDYRVTVNEDGTTEVTARTGEAEIYSPRGVERVKRGKTTLVRGEKSDPEFQTIAEIREDEWDHFNVSRDRELDRSESRQYLADDIVGAEELDQNGTWIDSAPYGRVWQPRVAAGWSPYSQGRWVWLDYYGWSWVSYDQFGWAPFHYGSWFNQGGNWCWYPGSRHTRTWWRPAMVAWFGFGGVNVGVGFGNFGWVPLAPFERFRPWYGRGFYGNNRTNIYANIRVVNNYNIINNYRNARIDGGAHGVAAGQFGRSGGRYDRVGEANLRSAGLMRGQLPASPSRESLAFNDRRVSNPGSRGGYDGAFYNRRPMVAQERIPFSEQQRGIEQGTRAFSGDSSVRGGAVNAGRGGNAVVSDSSVRGGNGTEGGWRRVGDRSNISGRADGAEAVRGGANNGAGRVDQTVRGDNGNQRPEGNGWRRFGEPRQAVDSNSNSGTVRGGAAGSGRELDSSVRGGGSSSGGNGWRRFGEPSSTTAAPDNGAVRGSGNDMARGYREYGRGQRGVSENGSSDAVRGGDRQRVNEPPPAPSVNRESFNNSIRVNPPVLRDRSDSGWRGGSSSEAGAYSGGQRGNTPVERSQYRSVPSGGRGGDGSFGGMRGGSASQAPSPIGGGMRGGGGAAPSGGNNGGSPRSDGGGHRGGGGRRGN